MLSVGKPKSLKINWFILIPAIIISGISILTLYFSNPTLNGSIDNVVIKQLLFVVLGLVVYLILSRFDYSYFKYSLFVYVLYAVTIILLLLTLIFGFGDVGTGARRWLTFAGFQLQPSEIAKVTVIICTAYVMTSLTHLKNWFRIGISFLGLLPILVMVYLQPHGSMTLILFILWLLTVFFTQVDQMKIFVSLGIIVSILGGSLLFSATSNYYWLLLTLVGVILFVFGFNFKESWKSIVVPAFIVSLVLCLFIATMGNFLYNHVLSQYQRDRIETFQKSITEDNPDDAKAWQVDQSKITIGSGQIWGKGWGKGTQSIGKFLPEHNTDFIFASFAEQEGFVGVMILLVMYFMILIVALRYVYKQNLDVFASTIITLLVFKIVIEAFINISTNTGILPATGIPLPLMSAGGTITIMTFFSLGLIQSIINNSNFVDNQDRLT
ncbi:MAG TPA: rod shape-determining protein RodA [Candidatus Dojkabacteria bacterium]|nr:rod shape-determining protein RodA [Candidatus Dojkabacteria bacterium]